MHLLDDDIQRVLFTDEQIAGLVDQVAADISRDYAGRSPLLICILRGAVVFCADLARRVRLPVGLDFMAISSYAGTKSTGTVRILMDLDTDIEGRDILIVEDIIDTGLTLSYLVDNLKSRKPASLKVAVLLDKPDRRKAAIEPDYIGARIPDEFVVGYGLDYDERYRNLPYIGVLKRSVYTD